MNNAANNTIDRRQGVVGEVGCKYPALVATMSNILLEGEQTVNGVAVVENDIVLVNLQLDPTENGVYVVSTGTWQRAVWFDNELDATEGTLQFTTQGTQNSQTLWRTVCADNPIVFGTSLITFEAVVTGHNTGDVTLEGEDYLTLSAQIITAHKIELSNMTDLAANSFIGNNTSSPMAPIALTDAQATASLNIMTGDSGLGGLKGLVPAQVVGDGAKFLRGDGTWNSTSVPAASETVAGIAKIATQAITVAGTDDTTIVSPKKLLGLFPASINSTNGYAELAVNIGGTFTNFIIQWGIASLTSGANTAVTLPVSFSSACLFVSLAPLGAITSGAEGNNVVVSKTTTTITLRSQQATSPVNMMWIALGF